MTFSLIQVAFLSQPNMVAEQSWFCGFQAASRECMPNGLDSYTSLLV